MIAEVIVDVSSNQVNRSFDYLVGSEYEDIIAPGYRVSVPFGKRKVLGFVIALKEESEFDVSKLKPIYEVLDLKPIITKEFIDLSKYMVERYYTFFITALKTMIPTSLKVKYLKRIHLIDHNGLSEDILNLFKNDYYTIKHNDPILKTLKKLVESKNIEIIDDFVDQGNTKTVKMVSLKNSELDYKSSKGEMVIKYLLELDEDVPKFIFNTDLNISDAVLKTLEAHNNIEIYDMEVYRSPVVKEINDKRVTLNEIQENAYSEIKEHFNEYNTYLLHGVCGSGKTEIYLNLIEDVLKEDKEVVMLVPEISLTPQMTQRFKARFHDLVAVLHSRLSQGEKYDEWRKIYNGHAKIVVGARSAIFAPFENVGLIIIDEEHEPSYIQDTNPKYDAVDIAEFRAKYHNCPLILGSATPRVNSYAKAIEGEYKLINLPVRANNKPLPPSEVVDMREELKSGNRKVFSRVLLDELKKTYNNNLQSMLFINRRGFSTFVMCRSCGSQIKCPNCDVTLTYHKNSNRLKCHFCGYEEFVPKKCPSCESSYIKYVGDGTEKICEEISKELPGARILRVDYDTTKEKNSYERLFDSFKNHEADVMVGTQIIAKGLDFPLVSLVGVVNADLGLKLPDYDSAERSFDLLEQVSGRAGRADVDGKVIIQTYNPDHYAIRYASNHDYKGFYNEESRIRRISSNPPYSERVEIIVSSPNMKIAHIESVKIVNTLKTKACNSVIYGPTESFRFKLNNNYRYQITCKFSHNDVMEALLFITEQYQNKKDIAISISRV